MNHLIPLRRHGPRLMLGVLVGACLLSIDPAAAQPPPPWVWGPVPPGPFFGAPAPPGPVPIPPPAPIPGPDPFDPPVPVPGATATSSTDRCLVVVPGQNDRRFIVTASARVDPGIFREPRVQGLPVRRARSSVRR
jgi:hypothetical protein